MLNSDLLPILSPETSKMSKTLHIYSHSECVCGNNISIMMHFSLLYLSYLLLRFHFIMSPLLLQSEPTYQGT